jgi:hypothetical protein
MSNFMIVVFTLLGVSLIAGLFVYLTVLDAGRWRKKIETGLLPMGFEVCLSKEEKAALAQRLLIVNPRHQGKRLLMHLYRRASTDGSHNLYFCDYRFSSASGKARGMQLLLVCLISRELDLPRFSIDSIPETPAIIGKLFHGLSENFPMPGMERVKTGNAEHDERFRVYAAAGQIKQVLPLLERITTALRARGGACLYAEGDGLILSSIEMGADLVRHELDSQKLLELIHVTSNLFETVRH